MTELEKFQLKREIKEENSDSGGCFTLIFLGILFWFLTILAGFTEWRIERIEKALGFSNTPLKDWWGENHKNK